MAKGILHQVTAALAVAEQELHFEHRYSTRSHTNKSQIIASVIVCMNQAEQDKTLDIKYLKYRSQKKKKKHIVNVLNKNNIYLFYLRSLKVNGIFSTDD